MIHEDCTLSSLEPLSLECELDPVTATLLEARIQIQKRLLTLLLPAEPSPTQTIRDAGSTIRDVGITIRDASNDGYLAVAASPPTYSRLMSHDIEFWP